MNRIVSAITATGKLTIGNYLGAIQQMVELQKNNDVFIFVADLHALTIDIAPQELKNNKKSILALYLACGIDPKKTTLFVQSDVKEHAYLSWILMTKTYLGELNRMTQFKTKSQKIIKTSNNAATIPTGLLVYPTLMAADILLYQAKIVPVGIDQKQHIELARTIAKRMNNKYNTKFVVPQMQISKIATKIQSLTNPQKKMSKSDQNPKSAIYLLDDPEVAVKKIMKSLTDSENKVYLADHKKGIVNLLSIYAGLEALTLKEAATKFKDSNYAEFKLAVAQSVKSFLEDIQKRYQFFLEKVEVLAFEGAQKARLEAKKTLQMVERKVGLK